MLPRVRLVFARPVCEERAGQAAETCVSEFAFIDAARVHALLRALFS